MVDTVVDTAPVALPLPETRDSRALHRTIFISIALALVVAPFLLYPVFLMKALCFALFAMAFNLLLGYGGLLSFGHATYFGMAGYVCAYAAKTWGLPPEAGILLASWPVPCSASSSAPWRSAARGSISR